MLVIKVKFVSSKSEKQFRTAVGSLADVKVLVTNALNRADVLVYELGTSTAADFDVVQAEMRTIHARHLLLVSDNPSQDALMAAIRLGAKEFLPLPLERNRIHAALDRIRKIEAERTEDVLPRQARIINILGSKGGVGTTTIAVNLAVELAGREEQNSVALVDMNTLFGDIPLFLDLQTKFHWGEITKNIDRMDDIFMGKVMERHPSGIQILTSPGYLNGHIAPTPKTIENILGVMQRMFDFIVIDAGQSTNDTCLKIIQMASDVLLVSTLSLPCLSNTNKLLQSYTNLGYAGRDKLKVLVNRYLKKSELSPAEAKEGIGQDLFWVIPNDYSSTMSAINQGKPLRSIYPKAAVTRSIAEMAEALASGQDRKQSKKRRKGFFLKKT